MSIVMLINLITWNNIADVNIKPSKIQKKKKKKRKIENVYNYKIRKLEWLMSLRVQLFKALNNCALRDISHSNLRADWIRKQSLNIKD